MSPSEIRQAAAHCPRPDCYAGMDFETEWLPGYAQMMDDLRRLAADDGCIAAAWALSVIEKASVS